MAQVKTYIDASLPGRQYTTGQVSDTGRSWASSYTNNGGSGVKANAPYSNGSYTKPNSTNASYSDAQAYVRNPTLTTKPDRGNTPQTPSYTPRGGGGVNTTAMDSAYSSTSDDIVSKIKSLLDEQKKQADEYYKTLYEQQIAQNKQQYRANQDQINLNRVRGRNYINQLYGDAVSGPGISNRVRNDLNWASNSASNRLDYTNNDASALASYNSGLANNASQLAQGWYNYVLPVYTNRQQTEDDYAYRRYLATL